MFIYNISSIINFLAGDSPHRNFYHPLHYDRTFIGNSSYPYCQRVSYCNLPLHNLDSHPHIYLIRILDFFLLLLYQFYYQRFNLTLCLVNIIFARLSTLSNCLNLDPSYFKCLSSTQHLLCLNYLTLNFKTIIIKNYLHYYMLIIITKSIKFNYSQLNNRTHLVNLVLLKYRFSFMKY